MSESAARPRPRVVAGIRARVVVWYFLLFGALLAVAVLTTQALLVARFEDSVDRELAQEIEELRLIAQGNDPETGEPFGTDARAVFKTYLEQNVPAVGEAVFTLVDGEPDATSAGILANLFEDDELVAAWASAETGTYGDASSAAGPVRWLAAPVGPEGNQGNTFAVVRFTQQERDDIWGAVRFMGLASAGVLLLATSLGWVAAGRALRPLRDLEGAARRAESSDLSERLPVVGNDEVAQLTRTFNSMLERLESAFVMQRTLLGDVGHDLRTPLTIVRGNLELLPEDPEERAAVVAMCVDEIDRMDRYISDLFTLAKAQSPDFLVPGPVELDELTDDMHARAVALSPQHDWVVEARASAVLECDGDRLVQAWLNLVQNAVQHTPAGGRIAIGSEVADGTATLWVNDTGSGVPPEDRARIFDRFARTTGSERRRPEGSGLGLAIVAAIAEAHGGRADLVDRPGPGSTFRIVLPVPDHDRDLDDTDGSETTAATGPRARPSSAVQQ